MSTMQSKLVSRTIWLEKKKIWKINIQKNGELENLSTLPPLVIKDVRFVLKMQHRGCLVPVHLLSAIIQQLRPYLNAISRTKALETTNIYTIRNRYNNHIKPIIGKIPVMLLTKQDLKRVIYTAYRKCDLSQKSLKNIRGDLSGFCNYSGLSDIRNDLHASNKPLERILPSNAKRGWKKTSLDVSSLNILFTESQVLIMVRFVKTA